MFILRSVWKHQADDDDVIPAKLEDFGAREVLQ